MYPARAVVLIGSTFAVIMLGTTLPTPLYPLYQQQLHFGVFTSTVVYAVYAAGVLAALLGLGRASDVIGRRPVIFAGVIAAVVSALIFLLGHGLPALISGRIFSGLSAGLITATATVTLVDLVPAARRSAATLAAGLLNMVGLGCGPLLAGLLVAVSPYPLRLPFAVHLIMLALIAVGLAFVPETVPGRSVRRLRPQRPSVPAAARPVFVSGAVAVFAAFAVFGLLTAIEPALLGTLFNHPSPALTGAFVASMFGGSAVGQVVFRGVEHHWALPLGCLIGLFAVMMIAVAILSGSAGLLLVGTIGAGIGQGIGFRAALAAIADASPVDQRADATAALFVVVYCGISVPVIMVGLASAVWSLPRVSVVFTVVVALLLVAALLSIRRLATGRMSTPSASADCGASR